TNCRSGFAGTPARCASRSRNVTPRYASSMVGSSSGNASASVVVHSISPRSTAVAASIAVNALKFDPRCQRSFSVTAAPSGTRRTPDTAITYALICGDDRPAQRRQVVRRADRVHDRLDIGRVALRAQRTAFGTPGGKHSGRQQRRHDGARPAERRGLRHFRLHSIVLSMTAPRKSRRGQHNARTATVPELATAFKAKAGSGRRALERRTDVEGTAVDGTSQPTDADHAQLAPPDGPSHRLRRDDRVAGRPAGPGAGTGSRAQGGRAHATERAARDRP